VANAILEAFCTLAVFLTPRDLVQRLKSFDFQMSRDSLSAAETKNSQVVEQAQMREVHLQNHRGARA
jgi:hypothetical protein